jgi:hypothetical protein
LVHHYWINRFSFSLSAIYAIEWQLWYKALNSEKGYFFVDVAALDLNFYNLLPKDDKEKLENLDYFF